MCTKREFASGRHCNLESDALEYYNLHVFLAKDTMMALLDIRDKIEYHVVIFEYDGMAL